MKRSRVAVILGYASLGVVLLGAILGLGDTIKTFADASLAPRSWADLGPSLHTFFGALLANVGAVVALICAIVAESKTRPPYLWIATFFVSFVGIISFSGLYVEFLGSSRRFGLTEVLFWFAFLFPLTLCVITGVLIGLTRKLRRGLGVGHDG